MKKKVMGKCSEEELYKYEGDANYIEILRELMGVIGESTKNKDVNLLGKFFDDYKYEIIIGAPKMLEIIKKHKKNKADIHEALPGILTDFFALIKQRNDKTCQK